MSIVDGVLLAAVIAAPVVFGQRCGWFPSIAATITALTAAVAVITFFPISYLIAALICEVVAYGIYLGLDLVEN